MFQYLGLLSGLSTFTVALVKNLLVVSGAATFINRRMRPYSQFPSDKIEGWSSGVTRKAGPKVQSKKVLFHTGCGRDACDGNAKVVGMEGPTLSI